MIPNYCRNFNKSNTPEHIVLEILYAGNGPIDSRSGASQTKAL